MDEPYYCQDSAGRESRVTKLFTSSFYERILSLAGFHIPAILISELDKSLYSRQGDVDIVAVQLREDGGIVETAAFEVKVSNYRGEGVFKSLKEFKHLSQISRLKLEGWDQVSLVDVVVTDPYPGWMNPYVFEISDSFQKQAGDVEIGHHLIIKTSVLGRSEEESGGYSSIQKQSAQKIHAPDRSHLISRLEEYFRSLKLAFPSYGYVVHDAMLRKNESPAIIQLFTPNMLFPFSP